MKNSLLKHFFNLKTEVPRFGSHSGNDLRRSGAGSKSYSALTQILGMTVLVGAVLATCVLPVCAADNQPVMSFSKDGLLYVDGKPYIKRQAFFGYNHWMRSDHSGEVNSLGNFMRIPFDQLGTDRDFYSLAGFNGGLYTPTSALYDGRPENGFLIDCLKRARRVGQKVTMHIWQRPPQEIIAKLGGFDTVNAKGEHVPAEMAMFYEPKKQAEAVRLALEPIVDAVRDDTTLIGYQIGGEGCCYFPDISYDDFTTGRYRKYLQERFSLEQISQRYGKENGFYHSWEEVFPPVSGGKDFKGRHLDNFNVAMWDWYRFRKSMNVDVWLAMIKAVQDVDGRGRPIHYEYNHGPFSDSRMYPMAEVCAKSKGFSLGSGYFGDGMEDLMAHFAYVKTTGPGPWINNELNAGSGTVAASGRVDAAEMRRCMWGVLSMGSSGFNLWTFFNILGAKSEFMNDTYYDPKELPNLPLKFWEVRHANAMIASLGELLANSKSPSMPIGLFELDDSVFNWAFVSSYMPDESHIDRAAATHGLADQYGVYSEYHLDTADLSKFKAIILPRTPRITDEHVQKLADYVQGGGTLILMGPTAKVDGLFKNHAQYPYGPLTDATGIIASDLSAEEVRKAPVSATWKGKKIFLDVQSRIAIPTSSKAQVLVQENGQPLVTVNSFGKGHCFYLAGEPLMTDDSDPTGDFIASLLSAGGANPAAALYENDQVDTGVFSSRRIGPHGTLLFLIENADRSHQLSVKLDPLILGIDPAKSYRVLECFSDDRYEVSAANGWSFSTQLEPVGVRCYLITEENSLAGILPEGQRLHVSRQTGEVLETQGPKPDIGGMYTRRPYMVEDAIQERLQRKRGCLIQAEEVHPSAPRDLGGGFHALDLGAYATSPLTSLIKDVDAAPKIFGEAVVGQLSKDSLPIRPGANSLGDVPMWSDGRYVRCEREMRGVPVDQKVKTFSFFHGIQSSENESAMGYYRINYADNSSVRVPIVLGVTLSDFTRGARFPAKTVPIWEGHSKDGKELRKLYRYDWVNPFPNKKVTTVDLVNNRRIEIAPFSVWGITVH